jgi:hypothetical protein
MRKALPRPRRRPRVLLLSGWSDGPLGVLRYAFPDVDFVQLDIPTPPAGTQWLRNRYVAALAAFLALCAVGVRNIVKNVKNGGKQEHPALLAVGLLAFVFFVRLLVYNIVRQAVKDGMRAALGALPGKKAGAARRRGGGGGGGGEVAAIVGFSWGGGVLWQMLCEDATAEALARVPALLLAPTIQANVKCSGQRHRPPRKDADFSNVHVVCGSNDPFCPASQEELIAEQSQGGAHYHTVDDDHVLFSSDSRRLYCGLLQQMLKPKPSHKK